MATWISSFPRSGNTMLRQVLHSGWGVLSGSLYAEDLGDNLELIRSCGHVELPRFHGEKGVQVINVHKVMLKTHEKRPAQGKHIYIYRDGRQACVSYWQFLGRKQPIEEIVAGETFVGLWSDHVLGHLDKADLAIAICYEDFLADPSETIASLSTMLGEARGDPLAPLGRRDEMAESDGKWVRKKTDWRESWSEELDALFWKHNAPAMERLYPDAEPFR